jgi:hypothetical protein
MPHLLTILILLPAIGAFAFAGIALREPPCEDHYKWIA